MSRKADRYLWVLQSFGSELVMAAGERELRRLSLAWFRLAPKMLCGMRESWLPRGEHEENCSECQEARRSPDDRSASVV